MPSNFTDEWLHDRRLVVMGLGRFGGGIGVTRFLVSRGARVLVTDRAGEDTLRGSLDKLADLPIEYRLGEHRDSDLDGADLLVISPAVDRQTSDFFQSAVARGVPWTTEMNLFLSRCRGRLVGVTGSIGKSTTCAMTHRILEDPRALAEIGARRAHLGGNIGASLLECPPDIASDDVVVLELSSFQLDCVGGVEFSIDVGGVTNVRPHHLDRHGTFEAYLDAKLNLVRALRRGGRGVVGTDDAQVVHAVETIAQQRCGVLVDAAYRGERYDLRVPGEHNQANAHLAAKLAGALGVSEATARAGLAEFAGLPHRLEFVREVDGVRYYNDSKATSPEAVATALAAFDGPLVVLCGGKDIGAELDRITEGHWDRVRTAITFGESAARLAGLLGTIECPTGTLPVQAAATIPDAVARARQAAQPGDVVVLSPGCPSYDAFVNYEARGELFAKAVTTSRAG
jgi:UDP-N-acetylmuramoylalanine--D-glutamate ligase